jgi:hypothetical protein
VHYRLDDTGGRSGADSLPHRCAGDGRRVDVELLVIRISYWLADRGFRLKIYPTAMALKAEKAAAADVTATHRIDHENYRRLIFFEKSGEATVDLLYFFIPEIERLIYLVSVAGNRFGWRHLVRKYYKNSERIRCIRFKKRRYLLRVGFFRIGDRIQHPVVPAKIAPKKNFPPYI